MRNLKILTILFLLATALGVLAQETPRDYDSEALNRIKRIHRLLEQQTELPFDKTLEMEISNLTNIEHNIEDKDIQKKIDQIWEEYDDKKKELKAQAAKQAEAQAAAQAAAQKAAIAAQAERDSINRAKEEAKQEEIREKEKKHQNRLIILGIIAAVVMFVSNQTIQTIRNKKTQRSIEQMQQNATKQIKNRVRSKVDAESSKGVSKATGTIQKTGRKTLKNVTNGSGIIKGKGKNISI